MTEGERRNFIEVDQRTDCTVVWLRGEQDIATLPILADALATLLAEAEGDIVVDLAMVEFMDAGPIGALARAHYLLRLQGRRLILRSPSRGALRVIELCGLTHLLGARTDGIIGRRPRLDGDRGQSVRVLG
jgi:anti-anti-sigma factor